MKYNFNEFIEKIKEKTMNDNLWINKEAKKQFKSVDENQQKRILDWIDNIINGEIPSAKNITLKYGKKHSVFFGKFSNENRTILLQFEDGIVEFHLGNHNYYDDWKGNYFY